MQTPAAPVRRTLRDFASPLLVAVAIFALNLISLSLTRHAAQVAAVWPADGVLLGLMLAAQSRRRAMECLAAGLIGAILAEAVWGDPFMLALLLPIANAVGVAAAFATISAVIPQSDMHRAKDLMVGLLVTVAASLLSSLLGAGAFAWATGSAFGGNLLTWASSDALGYAILTPLVQVLAQKPGMGRPSWRFEAALMAGFTLMAAAVFGQKSYPFLFFIPLGLFVVAYWLELRGAAFAVLITALVAAFFGSLGRGPISLVSGDDGRRLVVLQVFLASMTVSILPIAAAMAERRMLSLSLAVAHKKVSAAARRAEEANRLAGMAETLASVGHWRRDLITGEVVWSPQMRRLFALPPDLPVINRALVLQTVHPEDREAFAERLDQAETEGSGFDIELRVAAPDFCRILQLQGASERGENGEVIATYGVAVDITKSKAAETELKEAARAKADFLANMSHEIRTPLASLLGFSNLLQDVRGLDPKAQTYIEKISLAGRGLLAAVDDILSFSKLEAQQIELNPAPLSLAGLAEDALSLVRHQAEMKGLELGVEIEPSMPVSIVGDVARLRQILLNLLSNAVKFTGRGSVVLRIVKKGPAARFEVVDSGPGVSAARRERLFQRYSQVRGSGPADDSGTGLGLAICKGLVEVMGGQIGYSAVRGGGSRFWFEIPLVRTAPAAGEGVERAKVLIVDDLEINRTILARTLSPFGVQVTMADSGAGAIAEAAQHPYDLILLDLQMPGQDGFAVARSVRAGETNKDVYIIGVSAQDGDAALMGHLRESGFDAFLAKPYSAAELVSLVTEAGLQAPP